MVRHPLIIELRVNVWGGVYACTALLTLGAMLLIRSWLQLGQRLGAGPGLPAHRHHGHRGVVASSAVRRSIYSRDVYAYIGQGRLMLAGQDPYTEACPP
ncbi:hypothetical protein QJS66_15170 [Kocuria rhizophila]|nr:hypothetical protein QJS66_15170 [Kocuria rhizophila]